jgi:hypothetical protein
MISFHMIRRRRLSEQVSEQHLDSNRGRFLTPKKPMGFCVSYITTEYVPLVKLGST